MAFMLQLKLKWDVCWIVLFDISLRNKTYLMSTLYLLNVSLIVFYSNYSHVKCQYIFNFKYQRKVCIKLTVSQGWFSSINWFQLFCEKCRTGQVKNCSFSLIFSYFLTRIIPGIWTISQTLILNFVLKSLLRM